MTGNTPEPAEAVFPLPAPAPGEPAPGWRRLRESCPVSRVRLPTGASAWLVARYDDNVRLFGDARLSRAAAAAPGAPRLRPIPLEAGSLTTLDPPEHTRLRSLVVRAFTARRVAALRPRIRRIADGLVDELLAKGPPGELMTGFARPLSITVICELLGVPEADRAGFGDWTAGYLGTAGPAERIRRAADRLSGYLAGLVAEKRRAPAGDLLSELAAARDADGLDDRELLALSVTLLVAGYETAACHIGQSVHTLLRHPGQLARLRADPALLDTAVEELLRYVPLSAGGGTLRVALEDVELGGVTIRAGEAVLPATTSANRDAAVFDDPDRLDLTRSPNPHLAFGYGVHRCLGAQLARVELRTALAALLERLPGLRHAEPPDQLGWNTGSMILGPRSFPVEWAS